MKFAIAMLAWLLVGPAFADPALVETSRVRLNDTIGHGTPIVSPDELGEYASYNSTPASSSQAISIPISEPSSTHGFVIDHGDGIAYPTRYYTIYIGPNRHVSLTFYSAQFRQGTAFTDRRGPMTIGGQLAYVGVEWAYNPVTGLLIVDATAPSGQGYQIAYAGRDAYGNYLRKVWFDVFVSNPVEPYLLVQPEPVTVEAVTGTGQALTGSYAPVLWNEIRLDTGSDFDGTVFSCSVPGRYQVDVSLMTGDAFYPTGAEIGLVLEAWWPSQGVWEPVRHFGYAKVWDGSVRSTFHISGVTSYFCGAGAKLRLAAKAWNATPSLNTTKWVNVLSIRRVGDM